MIRKKLLSITVAVAFGILLIGAFAGCASATNSASTASSSEESESSEQVKPITPAELKDKGIYVQVNEGDEFDEYGNKVSFLSGSRDDVNTYTYDDPSTGYFSIIHTDMGELEGLGSLSMEAYANWEFDDKGRAISMTSTAPDGRVRTTNNWKYNDEGTMVEWSSGTGLVYTYDDYGYIIGKSNGTRSITYDWTRDETGMVTGYTETDGSKLTEYSVDTNEAGYITAIYRVTDGERASSPEATFQYQKIDTPSTCVALDGFCKDVQKK